MTNIVLLGGNGYIGRETTRTWLERDPEAMIYVISRSGENKLSNQNIVNLKADVSSYESVNSVLPDDVSYIVDFVGRPEKDTEASENINKKPAIVMRQIAEEKNVIAMGFIGGVLGPSHFTKTKKELISYLKKSNIKLGYVEPTIVYGADRSDSLSKMVPLFKVLGVFSEKMKPSYVGDVANELISNILGGEAV